MLHVCVCVRVVAEERIGDASDVCACNLIVFIAFAGRWWCAVHTRTRAMRAKLICEMWMQVKSTLPVVAAEEMRIIKMNLMMSCLMYEMECVMNSAFIHNLSNGKGERSRLYRMYAAYSCYSFIYLSSRVESSRIESRWDTLTAATLVRIKCFFV